MKGSKKAAFHDLFCADAKTELWRVGAGISTMAQVLLAAVEELEGEGWKKLVDKEMYKKMMAETKDLKPHLAVLNFGKGSEEGGDGDGGFAAIRRKQNDGTAREVSRTEQRVAEAAKYLYAWLKQEKSAFRQGLKFLAAGGVLYGAFCKEKTIRAGVLYKPASEEDFVRASLKRWQGGGDEEAPEDRRKEDAGLFS